MVQFRTTYTIELGMCTKWPALAEVCALRVRLVKFCDAYLYCPYFFDRFLSRGEKDFKIRKITEPGRDITSLRLAVVTLATMLHILPFSSRTTACFTIARYCVSNSVRLSICLSHYGWITNRKS